jgi:hypothetical protein
MKMWFCFLAENRIAQQSARDRSGNPGPALALDMPKFTGLIVSGY